MAKLADTISVGPTAPEIHRTVAAETEQNAVSVTLLPAHTAVWLVVTVGAGGVKITVTGTVLLEGLVQPN